MIILYEEYETEFNSLGLGILRDATECTVKESLNDSFTLEMKYDIKGANYEKIKIGRIIAVKPNPYDDIQPFRIYAITKPIKGMVTVMANHISYDMNGLPVKAIDAKSLGDVLNQIQTNSYISNLFRFSSEVSSGKSFKTTQPYNMRALLMGDEENSILGKYDLEVKFDKYQVKLYSKRGKNRGAQVCYGYNMTDLKHEIQTDKLYSGVFPYYHKETTSNETTTEDSFKKAYIVSTKIFEKDWLSYSENGEPFEPYDDTLPVQIATEGIYYEKVYTWDSSNSRWKERIYNESVTLIQGAISPSWIAIDWSKFPTIVCRANAKGYFKTSNDTTWGDIKGVGDEIFSGNIVKEGLSGFTSNLIIYYAEVIPSGQESSNEEVTEVVDVVLDDPIIKINTSDVAAMRHERILMLDLTSEFDEEPSKEKLKLKAEEFISKNKIGNIIHTTTVSFIDLQNTTEAGIYQKFEHVELGDTVRIIYRDMDVDTELRVISTDYDVISGHYNSVELGTKEDNLSSQSIQNGDSISSLSNDVGYADITTVNKLVANTVTAEFINAVNAKLSKAQIEQLSVEQIECKGIFTASQMVLDELVAKMLIAENAKISQTLEAGNIKVAGDISIKKGKIEIKDDTDETYFKVDEKGNVEANSVNITGGGIDINKGIFSVDNLGNVIAQNIKATGGTIADLTINENLLSYEKNGYFLRIQPSKTEDIYSRYATIEGTSANFNMLYLPLYTDNNNNRYSSYFKVNQGLSHNYASASSHGQESEHGFISAIDFNLIPILSSNGQSQYNYTARSRCGKIASFKIPNSTLIVGGTSGVDGWWIEINANLYTSDTNYFHRIYNVLATPRYDIPNGSPENTFNLYTPVICINPNEHTKFKIFVHKIYLTHQWHEYLNIDIVVFGD